ncbi:MAG TPA: hypothetical protein PKD67_03325, partial [Ignavibacteriaceae bacterium]|nr:hypothetical protein [Ignavibacteriaceae bacterium]
LNYICHSLPRCIGGGTVSELQINVPRSGPWQPRKNYKHIPALPDSNEGFFLPFNKAMIKDGFIKKIIPIYLAVTVHTVTELNYICHSLPRCIGGGTVSGLQINVPRSGPWQPGKTRIMERVYKKQSQTQSIWEIVYSSQGIVGALTTYYYESE